MKVLGLGVGTKASTVISSWFMGFTYMIDHRRSKVINIDILTS